MSTASWALRAAGVAVLYYAAARLGLTLSLPGTNSSPVWPPSGIAFAAILLVGYRVWPGIAIGAFLANLHTLPSTTAGFATSCGICVGNTLEPIVAVWLLRRVIGTRSPVERAGDVFALAAAAAAGCLVASANGVANLWSWGIVDASQLGEVWLAWWLGDMAGILILAPVILTLFQKSDEPWTRARVLEAVALFALLVAATAFVFADHGAWLDPAVMDSLPYAVVPVLAWAAFRFGPRETALAAAVVSAIAIVSTSTESLLMLQIFALAISTTAAALAGAVNERNQLNATLEQRVVERTAALHKANAALERSNQELDDFAHIASHDLKEPLRGIATYSGFLLEDYETKLDDDGKAKLDTLQRLTRRMEALIDSLLTYSRVGQTELAVQDTDLNVVVAEILESLEVVLEERGVEVRIPHPLPTLRCDRVRVGEVFRNLLTNAMKYNDKAEKWIEVGWNDGALHVRDNGIGIPEKHLPVVFRIFKRLHSRDEFGGGTGIGLTIVKKIVDRHGGRIWIESTPGTGTTFYFTLPRGQAHGTPAD